MPVPADRLSLSFGNRASETPFEVPVAAVVAHEFLDIAKIEFGSPERLAALVPLLPTVEAPQVDWLDTPFEIAGFGLTEDGTFGDLFFAVEPVVEYDDTVIVVDGGGRTGDCRGDSGGPLLGRANDGTLRVVGFLSQGSPSCTGRDYYTRGDLIADWLGIRGAPVTTLCEGIDASGLCMRGRAVWCDHGNLRAEACVDLNLVCGWDVVGAGFRCVRSADDPCEGLGSRKICENGAVSGCWRGKLQAAECGSCQTCTDWTDMNGAGCQ